ncbi:MAG: bifunctional DNA-formamidopyrimidine glycosylase/DNA-(apurinic or apyrimidinic site) lyase [Pirellulales bacterium]
MPELPEVETMRRGVLGIIGSAITAVESTGCRLAPISITPRLPTLRRRLVGRRVEAVDRVGKRLIVVCDSGVRLVIEPRMTGLVVLANPPNREHHRLRLRLAGGPAAEMLFWDRRGLGTWRLCREDEFAERFGPQRIGPDALTISSRELRDRLRSSRRAIKVALLDQQVLAGVGNLYASEILHVARIHPVTQPNELSPRQWTRLTRAIHDVLAEAIRYEGSTLGDGTYRTGLNEPGRYQNKHRVYDKAGQQCPRCRDAEVVRFVQCQRSTFFCPRCQPGPGVA